MSAQPITLTRSATVVIALSSLAQAIARMVGTLLREIRIRRDIARLSEHDDAMLHDIGLARSEIESALRHGRQSETLRPKSRNSQEQIRGA